MALVVFTGTFLAYLFNVYGIKMLGASAAGFYIYTQPFFATFIAMIFLKEDLNLYKIIAALLIFAGVYFVTTSKSREDIEHERLLKSGKVDVDKLQPCPVKEPVSKI